jgi:hypothetical protein
VALAATLNNLTQNAEGLCDLNANMTLARLRLLGRLETARATQGDRCREPLRARIGELLTEPHR